MKLPILLIISVVSLFAFSSNNPTTVNSSNYFSTIVDKPGELIIAIPNFNNKRIDEVIAAIRSVDGLVYVERCPSMQTFSIVYDMNKFSNADAAYQAVEKALGAFTILRKLEGTHADIRQMCE